jgi:hypothetical protein
MQRFKSPEQAQRFLETFSTVCNHFRPRRHRLSVVLSVFMAQFTTSPLLVGAATTVLWDLARVTAA